MSNFAEVVVIVEGLTEQRFIKEILAPYLAPKGVYLTAVVLNKPGEKGGDVKFARAINDIGRHLKQRNDTWVTLLVDYYAIHTDWPGYTESKQRAQHGQKADVMNNATAMKVKEKFPDRNPANRFIPYVSMHETEALYFSDPPSLAAKLEVKREEIDIILKECGEPEKINDHWDTAPSRRLSFLSDRFKKTSTGIAIAKEIGITKMREACPLFNQWVNTLENLRR
ncbi:MAG: DUF4276 family protein [Deltaproteobacteria bacterium]|nr:DUF4276 family protein [Deltaproteobacteria bacterium]